MNFLRFFTRLIEPPQVNVNRQDKPYIGNFSFFPFPF
jgi:hypothetical protein